MSSPEHQPTRAFPSVDAIEACAADVERGIDDETVKSPTLIAAVHEWRSYQTMFRERQGNSAEVERILSTLRFVPFAEKMIPRLDAFRK